MKIRSPKWRVNIYRNFSRISSRFNLILKCVFVLTVIEKTASKVCKHVEILWIILFSTWLKNANWWHLQRWFLLSEVYKLWSLLSIIDNKHGNSFVITQLKTQCCKDYLLQVPEDRSLPKFTSGTFCDLGQVNLISRLSSRVGGRIFAGLHKVHPAYRMVNAGRAGERVGGQVGRRAGRRL
jgi:hypothetical protein